MTITRNGFENTTVGVTIDEPTSLAGGDQVSAYNTDTGVAEYSDQHSVEGTRSAHFTEVAGTGLCFGFLEGVAATRYAWQGSFYGPSASGTQWRPLRIIDDAASQALLVVVDGAKVSVRDFTNADIWTSEDLTAWPVDTLLTVDLFLDIAAGAAKFRTTDPASGTVLWEQSMESGWSFSSPTATIDRAQFGLNGSAPFECWVDAVAQDDAATGYIGETPETGHNWFRRSSGTWLPLDDPALTW